MGYVMEEYLLEKFTSEIEIGSKDALHKQFDELGELLKNNLAAYSNSGQTPPSGRGNQERLESIRDQLYCLNNILSEYKTKSKSNFLFGARYWSTRTRLNKIRKEQLQLQLGVNKPNDVTEPLSDRSSSSPVDTNINNATVEHIHWSTPWIDTTGKINGFERELESLRKSLIENKHTKEEEPNNTFKAIGIVGMAGIGKTYFCQWLFNDEKVMNHFAPRVWVCMSREPNENEDKRLAIVKRMLVHLGVEEEMLCFDELEGLLSLLHQQLWGKRYLIVLDDARDYEDTWYHNLCCFLTHGSKWKDKLGYGLPKCSGGTVIVTSRNEETAKKMVGGENLHKLRLQDEASYWRIFRDSAEAGDVQKLKLPGDDDDKEIRNEIMQKCEGLPLAAKLMGQIVNQHTRETQ